MTVVLKQNLSPQNFIQTVPVANVKKVKLTRNVTPDGIYYTSNDYFYQEAAFVIVNNYLIAPANYSVVKYNSGDYNAIKFNSDPGQNSTVELIAAFK